MLGQRTKMYLLMFAGALLVFALIWTLTRGASGELVRLADSFDSFGYDLVAEEFFAVYDSANTSIRDVLPGDEADELCALSREEGFPADIDSIGGVTVLLYDLDGDTLVLYLLDGETQLAFIETEGGGLQGI